MDQAESLANVMMANFEATRLRQIKGFIETTDDFNYKHLLETKNDPNIHRFIKNQREILCDEESAAFRKIFPTSTKNVSHEEIELFDDREEIEDYVTATFASNEIQSQIKNILQENETLKDEISNLRQTMSRK